MTRVCSEIGVLVCHTCLWTLRDFIRLAPEIGVKHVFVHRRIGSILQRVGRTQRNVIVHLLFIMETIQKWNGEAHDMQRFIQELQQLPSEMSFYGKETINPGKTLTHAEYAEYKAKMEWMEAYLQFCESTTSFVTLRVRGGMPPAAANHQIIGATDRLNDLPHHTYHAYHTICTVQMQSPIFHPK